MQENAHNAFMAQAAQAQHFQQQSFNMQRNGNGQAAQAMPGGMPGARRGQDPNQDRDRSRREERQKQAGNKSGGRAVEGKGDEAKADEQQQAMKER
jgi:hypothetical protein